MNSNNTGRSIWDFIAEFPKISFTIILVIIGAIIYFIDKGHPIKLPGGVGIDPVPQSTSLPIIKANPPKNPYHQPSPSVDISTTGDNSPAVYSPNGNTTINYSSPAPKKDSSKIDSTSKKIVK